ncbi:MAG: aldehyde dehydrogenase family protein, partial [Pirellulales bacterium]
QLEVSSTPRAVAGGGKWHAGRGAELVARSPIDGAQLAVFPQATPEQLAEIVSQAHAAFLEWRSVPAPQRGQFVRRLGELLREHKENLAAIVAWEAGKISQEALGEVQEMIDICEFAVGLSRQLYGKTIATERPEHRMMEQWHPLGAVGVISAFNFPVAVWSWNAMLAFVCGDSVVWKPSEKTPLTAIACQKIVDLAVSELGFVPPGVSNLVIGGADVGHALAADARLPLISATGSTAMGRKVAQTVAARLGRSLLELGGNNAMIVTPSADLALAERAIVFAAVGTCGQRCTTLRRLIVHESVADQLVKRLAKVYEGLPIGHPLEEGVLVGPLIDAQAAEGMQQALAAAKEQGGKLVVGGDRATGRVPHGGNYVHPAIVEIGADAAITRHETFAPILYVIRYESLDDAIRIHNDVPQGLSSAIFTGDVREAERFVSATGSDCGIANVNIGTSGAEIGGAFGGEKDTGGGRESGSDSWQAYMRRTTNTINYSDQLPLAQGIRFETSS